MSSSKFNVNPAVELFPFKDAIGSLFGKICNDCKSFVGRVESENGGKNVTSTLSGVTITAKCIITSKEGYKMQLPLNNPMSILLRFGMELTKLDNNMGNRVVDKETKLPTDGLQSDIPETCRDWFKQEQLAFKSNAKAATESETAKV